MSKIKCHESPTLDTSENQGEASSSNLHQCLGCKKFFSRADLLRRHKQRKAKTARIPKVARQKSCYECANGKIRCDLQIPTCGACKTKKRTCVSANRRKRLQKLIGNVLQEYAVNSGNPNFRKTGVEAPNRKSSESIRKEASPELTYADLERGSSASSKQKEVSMQQRLITEQDVQWLADGGHDWPTLLNRFEELTSSPVPSCTSTRSSLSFSDAPLDFNSSNIVDAESQAWQLGSQYANEQVMANQSRWPSVLSSINTSLSWQPSERVDDDVTPMQSISRNPLLPVQIQQASASSSQLTAMTHDYPQVDTADRMAYDAQLPANRDDANVPMSSDIWQGDSIHQMANPSLNMHFMPPHF